MVKKLKKNLYITASETEGGKWVKAWHTIYKVVDGEVESSSVTGCYSEKKKECVEQIPVGKYILVSKYNEFKKETPFEVKAGEPTKVHVIFEQFRIEPKCKDMSSEVSYEVHASSGRMVYDVKQPCSKAVQLTLDAGDYSVEATVGSDTKKEKFSIGGKESKLILDLTNIKKEPSKQELIEADKEVSADVAPKASSSVQKQEAQAKSSQRASQESKEAQNSSVNEQANKEDAGNALKQVGALIGGMAQAKTGAKSTPIKAYEVSIKKTMPYINTLPQCYKDAKTLEDAKKCDEFANRGIEIGAKEMERVMGIAPKKGKPISHNDWSEETKKKVVEQSLKDVKNAKITLTCINNGANMRNLQQCVRNGGKLPNANKDMEQLGKMLEMFGGQ